MSWSKNGLAEWIDGNTAYISAVFSWSLQKAFQRAVWYRAMGYRVRAGGPAVSLNPDFLSSVAEIGGNVNALIHHNKDATFTTRGCIRNCSFCAVPKIEGSLHELPDSEWEPKPVICDNNLLAASVNHFDHVIERLKEAKLKSVDFNQGLDARLLTEHHAQKLSELKNATIRLAWDNVKTEHQFMQSFSVLTGAGIKSKNIQCYVLIGYKDTPEDAQYRLEKIRSLGAMPNPMRYQPLTAKRKNEYIDPNWTEKQLKDYMRYYSRLIFLGHIPFSEYRGQK